MVLGPRKLGPDQHRLQPKEPAIVAPKTRSESAHPMDDVLRIPPRPARILTDAQIKEAASAIGLIGGRFLPEAARYSSYELHASSYVEQLYAANGQTGYVDVQVVDGSIVIKPGATVRIYTEESINVPRYIWASISALGQLFGAGLAAGNTYVDPGSSGPIYLAITNVSPMTVAVPLGSPIARATFFVLGDEVSTAHGGPETRRPIAFKVWEHYGQSVSLAQAGEGDPDAASIAGMDERIAQLELMQRRLASRVADRVSRRLRTIRIALLALAALCFISGLFALTPWLDALWPWVKLVLVVLAGVAAAFALARTFIGGSVKEWIRAAEGWYSTRLERRLMRAYGLDE